MVSEYQKYMTFELMFMSFGDSKPFPPFEAAIPISLQKSLILVSHDMAGIVRPYLFRSISLRITRPIDHLQNVLSRGEWPHAVYIRYLNLVVDSYFPSNWSVSPHPHPPDRAASIIHACKNLLGLQLCIPDRTPTAGPGILPILEAMTSVPTLRVFRQVVLMGGEKPGELWESSTVKNLGVGLTDISLDLWRGSYDPNGPGHRSWPELFEIANGAALTLRRLDLNTSNAPDKWHYASPGLWSAMDTVLREYKFPALDYLAICGNLPSLDQFFQCHPQVKELRLKGNDPPDLTALSSLVNFHYTPSIPNSYNTSDYYSPTRDLDEADVAKALLTLQNPGNLKKLVTTMTSFSNGLPFLHQSLRCLRMVSLEELEVNASLYGFIAQQPIGFVQHDYLTLLQEMPCLRTVHFGGPIALFNGLPAVPMTQKEGKDGLRVAYVASLNTWAESIRPQLVSRIMKLARDARALERFHWEPICREVVDNIIGFDQHMIVAEDITYWNAHTDFIIHREKDGTVKHIVGGFHRLAPKGYKEYDFEQYSIFPMFPRRYAAPWRAEDMGLA